jgi:hypothetical protein
LHLPLNYCKISGFFSGILKKDNIKYFDSPRNILRVPGFFRDPESFAIIVLDTIGFHVFDEEGAFVRFYI